MSWYYAAGGQQAGPVTEEQFQALITSGTIRGDTLVWREGMANWEPYASVAGAGAAAAPAATLLPATGPATGGVICAECRQPFPVEQTARFGDAFVCERCKPIYVQRLREGAISLGGEVRYGGFWARVLAKFLDGLIVGVPLIILILIFGGSTGIFTGPGAAPQSPAAVMSLVGLQLGLQAFAMVIGAAYSIFFVSKYQATPGKMVLGLIVVNADGSRVSTGKATGRFFADILSQITCYIGYIIAAFDREKRALHDHVCNTRVVYKKR